MSNSGKFILASSASVPPTSFCYWVVPDLLLAGAYPGNPDPVEHRQKVQSLVAAGIRVFVNLMEKDETNYAGEAFVPYQDLAQQFCPEVECVRHPIHDLSVPTTAEMRTILDAVDSAINNGNAAYVHCWGGVGRTGTVVGCWLMRHRLAEPSNVLDVLMQIRQQDGKSRQRMSPETAPQQRFVKSWSE
jgi:protein-tyrosine phosphatase